MAFGDARNYGSLSPTIGAHVVSIASTGRRQGLLDRPQHRGRLHLRRRSAVLGPRHRGPAHRRDGGDCRRRRVLARRGERDRLQLRRRAGARTALSGQGRLARGGAHRHPDGTGAWIAEQNGTVVSLWAQPPPTVRYRACAPPHWSPRSPPVCDAVSRHPRLRPRRGQRQGRDARAGRLLRLGFRQAPRRPDHRPRLHARPQGLLADRRRRQRLPVRGCPEQGRCRGQGAAGPGRGRGGDARRRRLLARDLVRQRDGLR